MNNKKKLTLAALLCGWLLWSCPVWAQADRNMVYKVAIDNIGYTPKTKKETVGSVLTLLGKAALTGQISEQQDQYADAVRAGVISGVGNVRRFRAIEGVFNPGEIADGERAFYIDGTIANITTTSKTITPEDKKKQAYDVFKGQVSVTLNLKEYGSDAVVASQTFSTSDYDCAWIETAEGAISGAISRLTDHITGYFNQCFPTSASIIERGTVKKEKQKDVYIDVGTNEGTYKGQHYGVFVIRTIANKEAKREIGRLKVIEVLGEDISQCKVTKGGTEIKAALDANENVVARSLE